MPTLYATIDKLKAQKLLHSDYINAIDLVSSLTLTKKICLRVPKFFILGIESLFFNPVEFHNQNALPKMFPK